MAIDNRTICQVSEHAHEGVLAGSRVAVMVADGFEQREFDGPVQVLRSNGACVEVLAPSVGQLKHIRGFSHFEEGAGTRGDRLVDQAHPEDYAALLIPGGCISPDTMRQSEIHLELVREFARASKPIFSICHGPWLLADAGVVSGKTVTSWPGIRRDLERAGAVWVDEVAVTDGVLVTSRMPDDVPAFSEAVLAALTLTLTYAGH